MAAQIILEMLPISSSTHLRLIELWYTRKFSWNIADYFKQRNIALTDVYHLLHLPTLLVVLYFFGSAWLQWLAQPELFARIVIWVCILNAITVAFYYLFKKYSISWPLLFGMCITALVLFLTGTCTQIESNAIYWSFTTALYFGIVQGIALLPGISRLAFTTAAGCCIGIPLLNSFYISWFMYVPLMIAAIGKSTINLYHKGTLRELLNWRTCLVMLVSGIISWYVFTRVLFLILINKWWLFGWYMLIPIGLWVLLSKKKTNFHL
jgi:undecaprenyl pyrophosphate phosphatase UppP